MKIQNWEPATVVKILLDELDILIGDVIKMLQSCCETTNFQDTNAIQLNQSLSLRKKNNMFINDVLNFEKSYYSTCNL